MTDDAHDEPFPEMPCQELVDLVTAYLDGALSDDDRRRLEAHLGICPECVAYVEQIRATITATGRSGASGDALPADLREGLRRAFGGWAP